MSTDITILKQLTAIRLDVAIWTARRKLTAADLSSPDLPPETVASLGSKKVCNPEDLRIFATLKARACALLDRHGVRFLGGWMIPDSAVKPVTSALQGISDDFDRAKSAFLARYDEVIQDWIDQNPGWENLIAGSCVPADIVRARLGFAWQMFRIVPPRKGDAAEPLQDAVFGLGNTLFEEVARTANEAWRKSFAGKQEVSVKALSSIRTLRSKLAGLSFVEPRVTPVLDLLDTGLASIPAKGAITGASLVMAQGLVCLLRDPAILVEHGQRIIEGASPSRMLQELVALPPPVDFTPHTEPDEEENDPGHIELDHDPMPAVDSLGLW
jgi:hypothetical protein